MDFEEIAKNILKDLINDTYTSTCRNYTTEESLTSEKLLELIDLVNKVNPYQEKPCSLMKFELPQPEFKFDTENKNSNPHWWRYGFPIIKPTKTITIKVQKRKHKKWRINKKWAKRYGYYDVKKEVPDYGILSSIIC